MPTIGDVNLTMSRDTNGVVTARIDYTLRVMQSEVDGNVLVRERAALMRGYGDIDRYGIGSEGAAPIVLQDATGGQDRVVRLMRDEVFAIADGLGIAPGAPADVGRSVSAVLSADELRVLLEPGREHAYALVSVFPTEVTADVKMAPVEIDVGDPVAAPSFDAGGEPTALAVDGTSLYVATAGGMVGKYTRDGVALAAFPVEGNLSGIAFDGTTLWVVASDTSMVTQLDTDGNVLATYPTSGLGPSAVVSFPPFVWIANYGSDSVASINAIGQLASLTPIAKGPWALAAAPDGAGILVVVFGDAELAVLAYDGTRVAKATLGTAPWSIAATAGRAWVTHVANNTVTIVDTPDFSTRSVAAGSLPRGVALGGGSAWVASSGSQELLRLDGDDGSILESYPIGAGADAVIFDQDRVFVANRADRTISLITV